mgnify:CR=1 FL=1
MTQEELNNFEKGLKLKKEAFEIEKESKATCKALEEKLESKEVHLQKKDDLLDERQITLDSEKEAVREKIEEVKTIKKRLDGHEAELDAKLEEIARNVRCRDLISREAGLNLSVVSVEPNVLMAEF